jgi:cytidyltransferase-like protein
MKISVISGGFDPLHSGHISYIREASKLGDKLIVLLNSDEWLIRKKGKFFMPFDERLNIIENLSLVDEVIGFEDDEVGSCVSGLREVQNKYKRDEIIFCNGGDRNKINIPEMVLEDIVFEFSVGGDDKLNSSSWILKEWSYPSEDRIWGKFYDLYVGNSVKVKELIIEPGQGMSFQKHQKRNELWLVSEGSCTILHSDSLPENAQSISLKLHDSFFIKKNEWHQIINEESEQCRIIEIQYGEENSEDDIERLFFYDGNS